MIDPSLTKEDLAALGDSINPTTLQKIFGSKLGKLGRGFAEQQIAQAEADPFMWVIDLPDELSASWVRVQAAIFLIREGKGRIPQPGEIDDRHPKNGGGIFADGRVNDPEKNPRYKRALQRGEAQAAKYQKEQEAKAAKDSRYEELDDRITEIGDKLDTAVADIMDAIIGVRAPSGDAAATAPGPVPMNPGLACTQCDFVAKNRGGLTRHTRAKHRSEDGDSNGT
jgi:hypothetical protein